MPACPPTPSDSQSLLSRHCTLFILRVPTKRLIWKRNPPIFNSSLFIFICHHVSAAVHSVASPLPATSAVFPHMQACKHMQTHTWYNKHMQSFSKFPALKANWLQLAQGDNKRKSKVKQEEREKEEGEKKQGNSRVHKPTGFRWISSKEQIFHSFTKTPSVMCLNWMEKQSGPFCPFSLSSIES